MTTYKNFMSLRESINIYFSFLKLGLEFLQFVAGGSVVKNLPAIQETRVGEGNGTHYSTLAWKLPWMEEPGRLQSMGLLRVGHNRATSLSLFLSCIGEGNGNPLQCSCLENPRDGAAWWAAV